MALAAACIPAAEDRTRDLIALIDGAYRAGGDVEDFYHPTAQDRVLLRLLLRTLHGLPAAAPATTLDGPRQAAQSLGFELGRWHDCHLLREVPPLRGRGMYLIAPTALHPRLLVQAPHVRNDQHSEVVAARLFLTASAAGLHCSTMSRYAVPADPDESHGPADPCHDVRHFLHAATQGAADAIAGLVVVQVHGYAEREVGELAGLAGVLSEGDAEPGPPLLRCEAALEALWPGRIGLFGGEVRELGATSNVQGAWLRSQGDDRFVHLELSPAARRELMDGSIDFVAFSRAIIGEE